MPTKNLVFIHGMFMTPLCWEEWVRYFQAQGYNCTAPAWLRRDQPIDAQRKNHPDATLGKLNLTMVVDHLTKHIQSLGDKPVLIGHSMGGLITQILVNRNLAAAGIAIDSAPPAGVFTTKWSFLKANFAMISPFVSKHQPRQMSFEDFQYAFVNNLPLAEQRAAYDRYVVPESRLIPQESLGGIGKIDFAKAHAPLLLIAGSDDHIIPASLNKSNYEKYSAAASVTDFKEFPGRAHFIIGQKDWKEVADYCLAWLKQKGI